MKNPNELSTSTTTYPKTKTSRSPSGQTLNETMFMAPLSEVTTAQVLDYRKLGYSYQLDRLYAAVSSEGIIFTTYTEDADERWNHLQNPPNAGSYNPPTLTTFNNALYLAYQQNRIIHITSSADGLTWTDRFNPPNAGRIIHHH